MRAAQGAGERDGPVVVPQGVGRLDADEEPILRGAAEADLAVEERPFTIAEAQGAREAFITSAGAFVTPVVEIDGVPVGNGRPGPIARRLRGLYLEEALRTGL